MGSILSRINERLYLFDINLVLRKPMLVFRIIIKYLIALFWADPGLCGISFATTYDCNFDCRHCYAHRFKQTALSPLTLEEKKDVIKKCLNMGVIAFDFVGGEISISPEFEDLVKACKPYKTYISLATNAYALDRDKIKWLKNIGIDKLEISIDSWDENEHDNFRNKKGSHRRCFEALSICREVGLKTIIMMTVIKDATRTENFKKMVQFAIENKNPLLFSLAIPFGKWEDNLGILITAEDAKAMEQLHKQYPFLTRDNYNNFNRKGCPAVKQGLYITQYGDVLPCAFCHISFGNIREKSLQAIRQEALKVSYFKDYHSCCLAAEDKGFIKKYLSHNYKSNNYPVRSEQLFFENNHEA